MENSFIISLYIEGLKKYLGMTYLTKEALKDLKKGIILELGKKAYVFELKDILAYKKYFADFLSKNGYMPLFFNAKGIIDINIIKSNINTLSFENCGRIVNNFIGNDEIYHTIILEKNDFENTLFILKKINSKQKAKIKKIMENNNINQIKLILNDSFEISGYSISYSEDNLNINFIKKE